MRSKGHALAASDQGHWRARIGRSINPSYFWARTGRSPIGTIGLSARFRILRLRTGSRLLDWNLLRECPATRHDQSPQCPHPLRLAFCRLDLVLCLRAGRSLRKFHRAYFATNSSGRHRLTHRDRASRYSRCQPTRPAFRSNDSDQPVGSDNLSRYMTSSLRELERAFQWYLQVTEVTSVPPDGTERH